MLTIIVLLKNEWMYTQWFNLYIEITTSIDDNLVITNK